MSEKKSRDVANLDLDLCIYKYITAAQDRGPFWVSYILNEILQHIKI